ncbi:hypothetical protein SASPL_105262 [Salvia splendens]|uniref:Pectinesterase inhibitor domain-containing protein n=1 Tax=Salvia splendens TaxID=180675 RepID=A0A8X9A959_SALSN|nr:uncharacterized protein LOC121777124 [Salvia splendens]KAG6433647.1 hypothetical protein SASPL_105262 [Salvia splendens]
MALNNNLNLLFILLFFSSLLLPNHLAQSPRPAPGSSQGPAPGPSLYDDEPAPWPSLFDDEPAPGPSLFDDIDYQIDTQNPSISLPPTSSEAPSIAPSNEYDLSPSNAPSDDDPADPALEKICESTDHPALCLSTVAPYLDGETDIQSVLDVAIQAGAVFSRYGQETAQKLAMNPGNPPQHSSVLSDCRDGFETAAENYGKAADALAAQDKSTVNSMLSAVITYIGDCQDTISTDSPLHSLTDKLINMTSNCLAISSIIN